MSSFGPVVSTPQIIDDEDGGSVLEEDEVAHVNPDFYLRLDGLFLTD